MSQPGQAAQTPTRTASGIAPETGPTTGVAGGPTGPGATGCPSLESVGRLAAGVAHEINTPIQFVGDSIHFLREAWDAMTTVLRTYQSMQQDLVDCTEAIPHLLRARESERTSDLPLLVDEVPAALDRAADGIDRVATIVRAMKEVVHPGRNGIAPHDLNHAVEAALIVARNEYKYCAELDLDLGDLPLVPCDLNGIHQVLLNLITNAAHAIQDRGSQEMGCIRVSTLVVEDAAVLRIQDNGAGIPAAIRDRIWEPFFTTKDVGEGTGQGLHIVHRIVTEQHNGRIECRSEAGVGSEFLIHLPLHEHADVDGEHG